jgi:hypothetical protein
MVGMHAGVVPGAGTDRDDWFCRLDSWQRGRLYLDSSADNFENGRTLLNFFLNDMGNHGRPGLGCGPGSVLIGTAYGRSD